MGFGTKGVDLKGNFRTRGIIPRMKNTELIKEFNRYVREHPEFADAIANNAVVVMQLEGNKRFNQWSRRLAASHAEEGHPIIYVRIQKLKPLRSRIDKLELKRVA